MYGGLSFILSVCLLHRVINGRVQVVCDNNKALFKSSKKVQRVQQQGKNLDILQAIRNI